MPLEGDISTPMAYFLNDPTLERLATAGLLKPEMLLAMRPGQPDPIMGLYMMQPYERGKIPVLFVHGLWSSPMTWMQMFNDLRSSPEIRDRYQFWFYLYPTAQPFWITAGDLREDLAQARQVVDPYYQEPSLDQMVLVGHSMGGLLSRLQTIHSRDDFWKIISDQPFSLVKADSEVRDQLEASFFFNPNPSIRRVITVGTPHRGSELSNDATQWISSKLIDLPQLLKLGQDRLYADNEDLIRDDRLLKIENSIGSLDPDSPFFPVMLNSPRAPWVEYHNIIGLVPERGHNRLSGGRQRRRGDSGIGPDGRRDQRDHGPLDSQHDPHAPPGNLGSPPHSLGTSGPTPARYAVLRTGRRSHGRGTVNDQARSRSYSV